jgi:hypothetical protein
MHISADEPVLKNEPSVKIPLVLPNPARIAKALREQGFDGVQNLGVEARGGVVTLTGDALSPEAKERVAKIVSGLPGVRSVKNDIVCVSKRAFIAQNLRFRMLFVREEQLFSPSATVIGDSDDDFSVLFTDKSEPNQFFLIEVDGKAVTVSGRAANENHRLRIAASVTDFFESESLNIRIRAPRKTPE